MTGKSTLDIGVRNVKLTFKLMLMTTILMTVLIVVLISIFSPVWDSLMEYFDNTSAPTTGNLLYDFVDKASVQLNLFLQQEITAVITSIGYMVLSIFLVKFVLSLTMVPAGDVIATQMTTDFTPTYVSTFIKNIKNSFLYSLIGSLISILVDIPFSALIIYVAICLATPFGVFSYTTALMLFTLYFAVRISLTSQWIPNVVLGQHKPLKAFLTTLKDTPKTFPKAFVGNLCILSIVLLAAFATMVVTMFASLVIIIPTFITLFLTHSLVVYCHQNGQNYFVAPRMSITVEVEE